MGLGLKGVDGVDDDIAVVGRSDGSISSFIIPVLFPASTPASRTDPDPDPDPVRADSSSVFAVGIKVEFELVVTPSTADPCAGV